MNDENDEEKISLNEDDLFNNKIDVDKVPWIILKYSFENNREHGYKMHMGDILKLGKYILKVKEIGIENKKHIFDRKNTQKFIKNKMISFSNINNNNNNNLSSIPLNQSQQEENNYINFLNLNFNNNSNKSDNLENKNNIIIKINEKNSNNKENESESKEENEEDENNNEPNIHIIDNENDSGNTPNSGSNSNKNNSNNNKSNSMQSNNSNNNSFGFNTFHNQSLKNSSMNKSNFQSLKLCETRGENENENININISKNTRKYLTLNSLTNTQKLKNSIKELKSTASFNKKKFLDLIQKKLFKSSEKSNKPICRICLSEEHEKLNPLIHPCNCDGTMKYIHLECLKLLIQSKIKKSENDFCKILTFKRLECEICKTVFPEKISIKGNLYSIIDIEKPDKDYIILEGLIKETPEEKSIYIVHFKNKKEIKIGRATDANIRLNDISVSRAHATINLFNDNFYLHDTNSKFGTLIKMKNIFNILVKKPFFVQKGNIFYEFNMKKTLWACIKCYRQKNIKFNNYNDFFDEVFLNNYIGYGDNNDKNYYLLYKEQKTKSVSEYSSNADNVFNNNNYKIDVKSMNMKNKFNHEMEQIQINDIKIYKNNDNIENNNDNNQPAVFDSFRITKPQFNNNKNILQSLIINKTQENSNLNLELNINRKNDLTKSKSKEEINENDNSFELK